eukprot:TRINITY_DN19749_c0_g1_i1.p1 TRINITY_DN19749_c0_g1~~TRINITY_DN19749_c0_g1_i1.p1  ORF type:complete len:603 (-),score=65.00 TRINITY_DN19749_c0_g1_i1:41-1849(-)
MSSSTDGMSAFMPGFPLAMLGYQVPLIGFGVAVEFQVLWLAAILSVPVIIGFVATMQCGNVEFTRPHIPMGALCMSFAVLTILAGIPVAVFFLVSAGKQSYALDCIVFTVVSPCIFYTLCHIRGVPQMVLSCVWLLLTVPDYKDDKAKGIGDFYTAVCWMLSLFTKYNRDMQLCIVSGFLCASTLVAGKCIKKYAEEGDPSDLVAQTIMIFTFVYGLSIFARRRRILPYALRNVRYVTLGYLRNIIAQGGAGLAIKRCQEMPPEAFGDVAKAKELIITSHRWLDRYTCDVATPEFPLGLRLCTMVENLRQIFPESWSDSAGNGADFATRLGCMFRGMCTCSSDVTIFFDFAGLPQIGRTADGVLIERTTKESDMFYEALPAMGALYTMYNVLVLPEVSPGVLPYSASGWCYSEFCSAFLTGQLEELSKPAIDAYNKDMMTHNRKSFFDGEILHTLTKETSVFFMKDFQTELETKTFFSEDDRKIVSGIVEGTLLKALLANAISSQSAARVRDVLDDCREKGLENILNHAVDGSQDTCLHRAVHSSSLEVVNALLEGSADPSIPNLRGDTPAQFFMLPRLGANAQACRNYQSSSGPAAGYTAL